jgi:hypothetical protein
VPARPGGAPPVTPPVTPTQPPGPPPTLPTPFRSGSDLINISVAQGTVAQHLVEIVLRNSTQSGWWKAVVVAGRFIEAEGTGTESRAQFLVSTLPGKIPFWKAGFGGLHIGAFDYTILSPQNFGGCTITFDWATD